MPIRRWSPAAQKEGQVVWYSTLIVNQIVRPMAEAFEAKYPGIKVQYSRATSSDVALKIRNEARARRVQADLFDGSNTVFLLEEANLVAEYQPQSAAAYPAGAEGPERPLDGAEPVLLDVRVQHQPGHSRGRAKDL